MALLGALIATLGARLAAEVRALGTEAAAATTAATAPAPAVMAAEAVTLVMSVWSVPVRLRLLLSAAARDERRQPARIGFTGRLLMRLLLLRIRLLLTRLLLLIALREGLRIARQ